MKRHLLLAGLLLIGCNVAVAQPDIVGVFADPAATRNEISAIPGQYFDVYLLLLNASESRGLYGYELKMETSANVIFSEEPWEYPHLGAQFGGSAAPLMDFVVVYMQPNPLPWANPMILAHQRAMILGTAPGYIYIAPMNPGSVDPPAMVYIPGDVVLLPPGTGCEYVTMTSNAPAQGSPVFTINNCNGMTSWTNPAVSHPSPRSKHAMAFNSQDDVTVLFGGHDGTSYLADTWLWDGSVWTQASPAHSPSVRTSAAMVYDEARNRMVLFGGNNPNSLGDTWEWDGSDWTRVATTGPGARYFMGFAYDTNRQVCVLYGGNKDSGRWADTWEWDGVAWTLKISGSPPGNRSCHAMAYDGDLQKVLLFGGQGLGNVVMADTWTWDGASWVQLIVSGPAARALHSMAYHSDCGGVYLFGGQNASGDVLGDLWRFKDGSWTHVTGKAGGAPDARRNHQLVAHSARNALMLFGGYDGSGNLGDTWFYGPSYILTGVDPLELRGPAIQTHLCYPNPFNPSTTIRFNLGKPGPVKLTIYDLLGRPVRVLFNGDLETGEHEVVWDGTDETRVHVASGVYLYRLNMISGEYSGKVALLK